ncbi:hypothetical protein ACE6H2_022258 [Prunus campanulata]
MCHLIQGVKGNLRNWAWTIFPMLEEIRDISRRFHDVEWKWVYRSANLAAHLAASIRYRAVELNSLANRLSQALMHVLVSDCLPCSP